MTPPDRSQQDDPRGPLPGLGLAAVARGWVPTLAIALCALMATLAFASASAWAVQGHTFSTSFAGSSEHALAKPKGLAINQQTGQVYVVDSANNRVETFSASGTFLSAFGKAGTGTKGGEFKEPSEIAVDNSGGLTEGDVAVVDAGNKRVEIFTAEGTFLKEVSKTEINAVLANGGKGGLQGIAGVAIDGSGEILIWTEKSGGNGESATMYALPVGGSLEFRFDSGSSVVAGLAVTGGGDLLIGNGPGATQQGPAGEALGSIGLSTGEHAGQTQGLAVNVQTGDVYVDRGVEVAHFPSPTSTSEGRSDSIGSSGPGKLSAGSGIAVAEATDDVYVADTAENRVDVYTPTTLATAALKPAANVRETTAELTGEVNPEGLPVSDCEFEYGEANSGQYPNSVACSPAPGSGTTADAVSAQLSGLTPGGRYDARLSVTDANGTSYSQQVDAFRTVFALEVNTAGSGSGSVECEVSKSGHFEPCAFGYAFFTDLTLKAIASPGSTFTEWAAGSGNASSCDGQTGVCKFEMGFEPTAITAIFGNSAVIDFPLTVDRTGSGSGTVSCEVQGSGTLDEPCSAEYPEGTSLVITETPAVGSTFAGWSGECASAGTDAQCTLTIDAPKSIVAEFTETPFTTFALEVKKAGTGTGTVTSSPPGIDCGAECSHAFLEGEEVELTAAAAAGSRFEGWSGACSGTGTCRVLMSEAKGVEVTFGVAATFPLNVVTIGKGEVKSSPAGIDCGPETACTAELEGEVTLTALAETGYEFAGWLGCKYVTATTCKVDVTDESEVTAVFLKSGSEGPQGHEGKEGGEGPEGKEGKAGKEGATGKEGPVGSEGAVGAGERGPAGADGSPGAPGAQGPVGTAGPAGAQGPAGPAGKIELVTCTTVKQKGTHVRRCTTKLVTGTATFNAGGPTARASAVLSRRGAVFATGAARLTHGRLSLRLLPLKRLRAGRYTLTLVTGHGAHEHIRNQAFVLLPRPALRPHPSTP